MISSITGEVRQVMDDRAEISAGMFAVELLVPASDVESLRSMVSRSVTLHTIFYFQGDGNVFEPQLVGFLSRDDKRFFELFVTVKGIGPRTAIRALSVPVAQIASAIESRDARFLTSLKGIGKRTAEVIVAELAGKCGGFAGVPTLRPAARAISRSNTDDDAIAAMVALGERRADAEALLDRARRSNPNLASVDDLVTEMLRQRGGR
jgi:Holliday junction DNA helicase RuvA